ncbi:hypothetical protein C0Q70_02028 [Pomacea canaliculata]|uniref:Eukaryotic translation initiation factor 3 subunit D n=1 Tax=Pomacea canaliculata TaxID=400727 RepID=A0A2T7Q159_POMCA|nr:hypothetical protein C0Q70_02028 [Pomacea canaliculata]
MARFAPPQIQDNPQGWGPCEMPEMYKDLPYQPFAKDVRLGKVSDWTGATYQDKRYLGKYNSAFAGQQYYAYYHEEDESSFQLVDTARVQRPIYQRGRRLFQQSKQRRERERRQQQAQANMQAPMKHRDASVQIKDDWPVVEEMDFPRLTKLNLPDIKEGEDLMRCGAMETYDKSYDRITTKNEKRLKRINRIFHKVTTTDDPIIRELAKSQGNVFATDAILATIMCCTRSSYSWDIVVHRVGSKLFFDKRDDSDFDLLDYDKYQFENKNPFVQPEEESEVASVGYRYRKWDLGNDIVLISRCEHDAVMYGPNNEVQFISVKSLNEWDSRFCGGVDWRSRLDSQRGAVLATELKNNSCKLAKWTVAAILAGSDQIKFGYVSRVHVKDTSKHVILGTQQFKPTEFAAQINLNMDNAWGILRCIVDTCMKLKEGKYLIMKDPNKPVIRIYDIPDHTFESDDEDESSSDDSEEESESEDEADK